MATVMLIDDEEFVLETLNRFLIHEGHELHSVSSSGEAIKLVKTIEFDVIVSDINMPRISGLDLLKTFQALSPYTKVILITGGPSVESASEAVRLGAFDYLSKPVTQKAICRVIRSASRVKKLEDENRSYREQLEDLVEERTKQIREYSQRLEHIVENTKYFAKCDDVMDLAPRLLKTFSNNMGAKGGSIYLRDGNKLRLAHTLDHGNPAETISLPAPTRSVIGRTIEEKKPLIVKDIKDDQDFRSSGWPGYRNGSLLALPLQNEKGEVEAVMTLHDKVSPPFTDQDLELGHIIAAHSREALKNLHLSQSLRESENKYRTLSIESLTGILILQDMKLVYTNPRAMTLLGYGTEDLDGRIGRPFTQFIHPEDRQMFIEKTKARMMGQKPPDKDVIRLLKKDGDTIWTEFLASMIMYKGQPALMGNLIDITGRKEAEEEKNRLELQLYQSQKMEAIGRLAGGVAHDFNNLLTAIQGYSEMIKSSLAGNDPLQADIDEVLKASDRASSLTQQLLAFSRRQIIVPKTVDLNDIIANTKKMLERLIGEDVELITETSDEIACIKADPHQIEQVLINLAVNARDAMLSGGRLTFGISSCRLEPADRLFYPIVVEAGEYVRLTVQDTGCGIDEEQISHIFEPFYTTKEKDKGTGLGLSMVYGIIKQNNGYIFVDSELEQGTTFTIYLPAVEAAADVITKTVKAAPVGGNETILLVEDEEVVRILTQKILEKRGYHIIVAESPTDALHICSIEKEKIDLLLTDVVMPILNGKELYERCSTIVPDLKVLYISGYIGDTIARHGILEEGANFTQKPFTVETLSKKVRAVLDN